MIYTDEGYLLHCGGSCRADVSGECECVCADCYDRTRPSGMRCSCPLCPCNGTGDTSIHD